MRLITLRYSHVCARSFDPAERALEQQALAENAIKIRMASMGTPLERPAQQHVEEDVDNKTKYSNFCIV